MLREEIAIFWNEANTDVAIGIRDRFRRIKYFLTAVDSEKLNNYTRKANSKIFLEAPIEKVGAFFFFALKTEIDFCGNLENMRWNFGFLRFYAH